VLIGVESKVQAINKLKSQHDHKLNWFFIYDARAAPVIVKGSRVMLEGGQCTIFSSALRIIPSYRSNIPTVGVPGCGLVGWQSMMVGLGVRVSDGQL
jgi:hypothetical protein